MQINPSSLPPLSDVTKNSRLIIASAFAVGFGLTLSGYSISLFAQPMMAEFDWSLSQFTGVLFALPIAAVFFPLVGHAMDRRGERPIVLTSIFLLVIGYGLLVLVQPNVWSFYSLFTLAMVMGAGAGTIGYTRAVTREVENAKGFALALMLSGASIAGMVSPPKLTLLSRTTGGGLVL
ncbi:MAG: MFS transporter [Parvibaculaceae bacterium]